MKALTITVADDLYHLASAKAAAADTSLPQVVEGFLSEWACQDADTGGNDTEGRRRADFLKFLDDLAERPLQPGPSVGPLNREELYQRGISGH